MTEIFFHNKTSNTKPFYYFGNELKSQTEILLRIQKKKYLQIKYKKSYCYNKMTVGNFAVL